MAKILDRAKRDLAFTLESKNGFGNPVRLISPYGQKQVLYGQVSSVQIQTNVSVINQTNLNGDQEIIFKPTVCLRLLSLSVVPKNNEIWIIQTLNEIDTDPISYTTIKTYATEGNPILDENLGTITMQLTDTKNQTVLPVGLFDLNIGIRNIDIE